MPGDSAMLLDRDSHVDDEKAFDTEYFRIKIFKDEGRRFANIEIPYVPKAEEIAEIKARRVLPDGTAEDFHGEIFDRLIVKSKRFKYQAKVLTLPDVHAGDVIEYSYKMQWHQHAPDVLKHPEMYFLLGAFSVPTVHWQIQHELFTRHARFSVRPLAKAKLMWTVVRGPTGASVQREADGTAYLEVRDVPPLEKEEFAPPEDLIDSRIHFFYGVGLFEGPGDASFFWSSVGRRQGEDIEKFIGHSKKVQRLTAEILSPGDTDEAKLRKIYERVQQLRYLSYEPAKTEKEAKQENLKENKDVEDVLNHGYAYANEINYLFAAMVRAAGMQAYVVKLADRSRHVFNATVLDVSQFNAMVIDVPLGKEHRFFDPATRFCPFELVPWGESGVRGLRITAMGGDFVTIPGYHSEASAIQRVTSAKILEDGTLEGTVHISFAGQDALTRRLELYEEDEQGRHRALEAEVKKWMPEGAKIDVTGSRGWSDPKEKLQVDCTFSVPQFASAVGRRLLAPLSVFGMRANPFKSQGRMHSIYFPYSYRTEDQISLRMPEGFRLEGLPKAHSQEFNDSRFSSAATKVADGVEFRRTFELNGFIFDRETYGAMRQFFDAVFAADSEQMVLQQGEAEK